MVEWVMVEHALKTPEPVKERPHYRRWAEVPEGLVTKTTLRREGLKPAPNQQHVATVTYGPSRDTALLYRRSEAVPKKPLTEAQKAGILRAQETRAENERRAYEKEWAHLQAREEARQAQMAEDFERHLKEAQQEALQNVLTFLERHPRDTWRILDTETTGLQGEVISLSIVDGYGNVLYDQLLRPIRDEIEEGAFRVHGIRMEDLEGKPSFAEVWHLVEPLLRDKTLLAFNADFDRERLYYSLRLDPSPCWPKPTLLEWEGRNSWVCLMLLASSRLGFVKEHRGYFDGFWWLKLDEACWRAAITLGKLPTLRPRHQAKADALSSLELLNDLLEHGARERDGLPVEPFLTWPTAAEVEAAGLGHWGRASSAWLEITRKGAVVGRVLWWPVSRLLPCFWEMHKKLPDLPFEAVQAWWTGAVEKARACQPGELGECRQVIGEWGFSLDWSPEPEEEE